MARGFNTDYVRNLVDWEELENLKMLKTELTSSHLEAIFDQACKKESEDVLIWMLSDLKYKNYKNTNEFSDTTQKMLERMKNNDFTKYNTCDLCKQETNAYYLFKSSCKISFDYPQETIFNGEAFNFKKYGHYFCPELKQFRIKQNTVYCSKCIHLLGEYGLIKCPNCGTSENIHLNIKFTKDTCINPNFSGLIDGCEVCDYHCVGCHKPNKGVCKECLENSCKTIAVQYRDGCGPRYLSRGYLGCQEKECVFKLHVTTPIRIE